MERRTVVADETHGGGHTSRHENTHDSQGNVPFPTQRNKNGKLLCDSKKNNTKVSNPDQAKSWSWNRGAPMASRRGQILLAVFLLDARFAHAARHCFNWGALLCTDKHSLKIWMIPSCVNRGESSTPWGLLVEENHQDGSDNEQLHVQGSANATTRWYPVNKRAKPKHNATLTETRSSSCTAPSSTWGKSCWCRGCWSTSWSCSSTSGLAAPRRWSTWRDSGCRVAARRRRRAWQTCRRESN